MFSDTPLVVVRNAAALNEAAATMAQATVIGVDTESDSFYAYQERVCLLQVSDGKTDWVIDPLAVRDLSVLGPVMANPDIVKVFHGADYDIVSLRRDFHFQFANIFDTLVAAQQLGLPRVGLADLVGNWFGHTLDKAFQRHNWAERPLLDEHLEYARGDTHWLPALRSILLRRLTAAGRIRAVEEECRLLAQRVWKGRTFEPNDFLRLRGARTLSDDAQRALRGLYVWRDKTGQRLNRPVFKVLPDDVLVDIARLMPEHASDLEPVLPQRSALRRRHGDELVAAVQAGLDDTSAIEAPAPARGDRRAGPRPRLVGRQAERVAGELKTWRNDLVSRGVVPTAAAALSNGQIQAIASRRPHDLDELRNVPDVREWQVAEFGTAILGVLDQADPRRAAT